MEERKISAEKSLRINNQITVKQVRLIGAEGEQLGIVNTLEAIGLAESANLDLVEISPQSAPPVCRVMDYGKHLFQLSKKKAAAKKKQKQVQLKELKYRVGIEDGDYQVKLRKLIGFLKDGNKVKVSMRFRGREVSHHSLGMKLFERLQTEFPDLGVVENPPRFEGWQLVMVIGPKKAK